MPGIGGEVARRGRHASGRGRGQSEAPAGDRVRSGDRAGGRVGFRTRRSGRADARRSARNPVLRPQISLLSWIIGSSSFVLRSTASTMVRSSMPSALAATAGMIWRESGRLKRTVNVPSGRSWTGSPWSVTRALGSVRPVDDQLGVDLEVEIAAQDGRAADARFWSDRLFIGRRSRSSNRSRRSIAVPMAVAVRRRRSTPGSRSGRSASGRRASSRRAGRRRPPWASSPRWTGPARRTCRGATGSRCRSGRTAAARCTSIYQLLTPPWIGISRTCRSAADVVSSLETSMSRRIGRAACQSCPRAAWARARVVRLSSQ